MKNAALLSMLDHSGIQEPVILTANRGYESYNTSETYRAKRLEISHSFEKI